VPQIDSLPEGPYRALVLQGHELSTRAFAVIGPEVKNPRKRYAGNNLACTSCHQEGGAKAFAIPWVGVTATFPQYRGREDQISTVEERINGCMERSMNGKPLPLDAPEMKAFTTYIAFLSKGVPVGAQLEGEGRPAKRGTQPTCRPRRWKRRLRRQVRGLSRRRWFGQTRGPARRCPGLHLPTAVGPGQQPVVFLLHHGIALAGALLQAWAVDHRDVSARVPAHR
jgi:hypothetical protein